MELFTDKNVRIGVGVGAGVLSVVIFVCLYIVPLVKILKSDYFITNVNAKTAREAQKHNKKVRHDIAAKMIEITATVDGVGWYDSAVVGEMAIALNTGNEEDKAGVDRPLYRQR